MLRHGQWVRFVADIPGAHLTPDGKTLGIFQAAREGSAVAVDGKPAPTGHPAHVAVVRPDGTNLMRLSDDGQSVVKVAIDPADCPELEAAVVPDDLPRCDRNAHLFEDQAEG